MPKIFKNTIYFFLAIAPFFYVILVMLSQFRSGSFVFPTLSNVVFSITPTSTGGFIIRYSDESVFSYFLSFFVYSGSSFSSNSFIGIIFNILIKLNDIGFNYRFTVIPTFVLLYETFLYFIKLLIDIITIMPRSISKWMGEKV